MFLYLMDDSGRNRSPEIEDEIDIKAEEILRIPDIDLQTVASGYGTLHSSQKTVLETIDFAVTEKRSTW